ncbi:MAG: hypothetical protein J0L94_15295 [Rhodothermia bacterium]|nr:hypothetical protein [Rhodothermia bacterium]
MQKIKPDLIESEKVTTMYRLLLFIFLFGLFGCPLIPNGGDPFRHFPYPQSIAINLDPSDGKRPVHAPAVLEGSIEGRAGTLREVSVFFESSDDLVVAPPTSSTLATLSEQEKKTWRIYVKKGADLPDAGGSWVRLRVVYLPDYERLLALIADENKFPHEEIRSSYRSTTLQSQLQGARATDAARLFFE